MGDTLAFAMLLSLATLATPTVDPTLKFFQDTQYMPVLTYECYRTDVTIEPEGTVNFTILWDGTNPSDETGQASTWYAPNGSEDQYTRSSFDYLYDSASSTIKITSPDVEEHLYQLREAYNGLAYYWKLTITSYNDRVVYKVYDIDPRCCNAAALLRKIDRRGQQGFIFSRDVPEPRRHCTNKLLCAK